jgi:uncharacterized protein (UPF0128 family)
MSIQPRDTHVTNRAEVIKLAGQNLAILNRLQQGPATARELAELSLKYTSRVSDLRRAGHDVRCREADGRSTYFLVKQGEQGEAIPVSGEGHDLNVGFQLR